MSRAGAGRGGARAGAGRPRKAAPTKPPETVARPLSIEADRILWELTYGPGLDSSPDHADSTFYLHTAEELRAHYLGWARERPSGCVFDERSWAYWAFEQGYCEEHARYAAGAGQALRLAVQDAGLSPGVSDVVLDALRERTLRRLEKRPVRSKAGEPFFVEHFKRWAAELVLSD